MPPRRDRPGLPAEHAILWRRLDCPGHECARLFRRQTVWHLVGSAAFAEGGQPSLLDYLVVCDGAWRTLSARVRGWIGAEGVSLDIDVDATRRWRLNGREYPAVAGCLDVDLSFSPSTNSLAVRRLELQIGEAADVRAAWLPFPGLTLEPLEQHYRRTSSKAYHYESDGGRFTAELEVNDAGFITRYPDLWQVEVAI